MTALPTPPPTQRPEYVWTIDQIFQFFEQLDELLSVKISTVSGEAVADNMADLLMLYPSSVNVLSSAKWYANEAYRYEYNKVTEALKGKEQPKELKGVLSPLALKEYIKSRTSDFIYIADRAERCNAAITHSLDALRSVLSNLKAERQIQNYAK